jgi:hypothetical protein
MLLAALGIVGLAAVAALLYVTRDTGDSSTAGSASVASPMRAAGCTYEDSKIPPPGKGGTHIPSLATPVTWSTYPPSGGRHYGVWAVWGFYDEPVDPKQVVHNEEHGGTILWWGPQTPKAEVEKMRAFYNESPNSMFGTEIGTIKGKSLGSKVAITAWTGEVAKYNIKGYYGFGHAAVCPTFDEAAFKKFRDAYRGKGPEGVPTTANEPGMGPNG